MRQVELFNTTFYAELRRETDKAYCFYDGIHDIWVPKSLVAEIDRRKDGNCEVTVPEWFAKREGII